MDPVSSTYPGSSSAGPSRHQQSPLRDERSAPPSIGEGDRVELSPRALRAAGSASGQQPSHASGGGEDEFVPYGADGRRPSIDHATPPSSVSGQSQAASTVEEGEDSPQIQQVVSRLQAVEIKVKAHEAAHKAAGGAITGPVSYSYTRGPDGKSYITGGEVSITVSSAKTPEETVNRMELVVRAALAPADPSPQDRAVAARAIALAQQARLAESAAASSPTTGAGGAEESGQISRGENGPAERLSRTAPGEPTAYAPQENAQSPTATLGEVLWRGSVSPQNHGQYPSSLAAPTPAMITGFGLIQPLSLYA